MDKEFKERIKSRKLIVAIILFVSATAFILTGYTDFAGWSKFVQWIAGLYFAGNVGEHFSTKKDK